MNFRPNLGLTETLGLSLSMIAPTMAMSFVTTLVVQSAGVAAPLAFLIGTVAMLIVGLSFAAFEKRIESPGSAYAYVGHAFGKRSGFLAGWALLMTYIALTAGGMAMSGNFLAVFLSELGLAVPYEWMFLSFGVILIALWLARRDTRIAARIMLTLEAISVGAILFLALRILIKVPLSTVPIRPHGLHAWAGVGYGVVFVITSFAGFEGAATLSGETRNPKRTIPIAVVGTVLLAGVMFVLVSYAEVVGYESNAQALATADSPLNVLGSRFLSRQFAESINLMTAISAFAATLGSLSAAARMLVVLGNNGAGSWFTVLHKRYSTPARALTTVTVLSIVGLVTWGSRAGAMNYGGAIVTIGTLSLILVYISVTGAEIVEAFRNHKKLWLVLGCIGATILLWPLWNSLYPVPGWPEKLWPYVVLLWLALGTLLASLHRRRVAPSMKINSL